MVVFKPYLLIFILNIWGKKLYSKLIDIISNGLKTKVGSYKSYVYIYIRYILENLWGCAVIGCAGLVMPLDVLNKPYQIFAQELSEWLHVGPLQKRSHIWTAGTMQVYLEFLGGEIRKSRRELELPPQQPPCTTSTMHNKRNAIMRC